MSTGLNARMRALVSRARIARLKDSAGVQTVQIKVLKGEDMTAERLQNFGFTGHAPPAGSTGLVLCINGFRSHPVVVALDHPASRKKDLAEGESAQYNAGGDFIHLKADGTVAIYGRTRVQIDTPLTEVMHDLVVHGTATAQALVSETTVTDALGSMNEMREVYNLHDHQGGNGPKPSGLME